MTHRQTIFRRFSLTFNSAASGRRHFFCVTNKQPHHYKNPANQRNSLDVSQKYILAAGQARQFHTSRKLSQPERDHTATMAEQLASQIEGLSLDEMNKRYPNCHPTINPFDLYRGHLADVLHNVTGVEHKIIYPNLQWTSTLDKGDLILATPSLRVKGKKPDELAAEWAEKVCGLTAAIYSHGRQMTKQSLTFLAWSYSFPRMLCSRNLPATRRS
jgi:hypothetical protein